MPNSISFVVMAFNERKNLERLLPELEAKCVALSLQAYELIIVDDGSQDETGNWVKSQVAQGKNWQYLPHAINRGIGQVLRTGYGAASLDFVVAIPGDGQFELSSLEKALPLQSNEVVSFYRSRKESYSPFRDCLSRWNRKVNRFAFGLDLNDVNWVKLYPRPQLSSLTLRNRSSLIETEICAKLVRLGMRVRQVPTEYLPRLAGESKGASLKVLVQATLGLVPLFWELVFLRPLRSQSVGCSSNPSGL